MNTIMISVYYQTLEDIDSTPLGVIFQTKGITEEESIEKAKHWIYDNYIQGKVPNIKNYDEAQHLFTIYDKDGEFTEFTDTEGYVLQVSKLITL